MKTEAVIGSFILLGLSFKMMHWPGSGPILVLALSTLSLLYFCGAFYFFSYKGIKNQNVLLSIAAGFCFSISIVGSQFKIMHWPGAGPMMLFGIPGCIIITITTFVLAKKQASQINSSGSINSHGDSRALDFNSEEQDKSNFYNLNKYYDFMKIRTVIITLLAIILYSAN